MRYLVEQHPLITNGYSLIALADQTGLDDRLRELMALPVKSVATRGAVTIEYDATLEQVCTLLAQHRLKKAPVMRDGKIVGTVNRSEVIRYAMQRAAEADERR